MSIYCLQNTAHLHLPDAATNRTSPIQQSQQPLLKFKRSACIPLTSPSEIPARYNRHRVAVWYKQVPLFRGNILSISTRKVLLRIHVSHNSLYYFMQHLFCPVPEQLHGIGSHNLVDTLESCQAHDHPQQGTLIGMQQIFTACLTMERLRSPAYSFKGLGTSGYTVSVT